MQKKDNPKHVFDCIAVNSLTAITLGDFIDDISEELKDSNINENDIYLSVQSIKPRPGEWGYKDWCFSTKNLHFTYIFIINNEWKTNSKALTQPTIKLLFSKTNKTQA